MAIWTPFSHLSVRSWTPIKNISDGKHGNESNIEWKCNIMDVYDMNKHVLRIIWCVECVIFWFGAYKLKIHDSLGYSATIYNLNWIEPNLNCGVLKKNKICKKVM